MIFGQVSNFYTDRLREQSPKISPLLGPIGTMMLIRHPEFNQAKTVTIMIVVLTLINMIITAMVYLALVVAFRDRKQPFKYWAAYKEGARWVLPAMLTGLMVWLLKLGAVWWLWLPAAMFGVWFSLTRFVVVYRHQWGNRALVVSRELIRRHGLTIWLFYLAQALVIGAISLPLAFGFKYAWGRSLMTLIMQTLGWLGLIFTALIYERLSQMKPKLNLGKSYKYWLVALTGYLLIVGLAVTAVKAGRFERWLNWINPRATDNYRYTPLPSKFNPEIKEDFEKTYYMIEAYRLGGSQYPDSLDQLDKIPLNKMTNQPFNYHPRADRNGVNAGFTLCPKLEDPLEYCYRQ